MKELILRDRKLKLSIPLVVIVIILIISIVIYLYIRSNYDMQIDLEIYTDDIAVLKKRLKAISINNFRIVKNTNNKEIILYLKKTSLSKNYLIDVDHVNNILLSNHIYEVYFVSKKFRTEVSKYFESKYTYPIDFNSVLTKPVINGLDIAKVKITSARNNLNDVIPLIEIKLTKEGKTKNENASKNNDTQIKIIFLNSKFWTYGFIFSDDNFLYISIPILPVIERFKMDGKDYTYSDIRNITLFSKYNFNHYIKLISIKDRETRYYKAR